MNTIQIAAEIVSPDLSPSDRFVVLIEIVKKTENLQVRAIAVLYADRVWEVSGNWTKFCRDTFGWDDSYASRMKRASEMILSGSTVTTESQARVLAQIPDAIKREEVLARARESVGREPSNGDIADVIDELQSESGVEQLDALKNDQYRIDVVVELLREALREVKRLPTQGAGRWVNTPHIIADLKNAANALKHARPHGDCDEGGEHDVNCLCGGSKWLPQHVLERPRK